MDEKVCEFDYNWNDMMWFPADIMDAINNRFDLDILDAKMKGYFKIVVTYIEEDIVDD